MSITRQVLKWCDKTFEEALCEEDDRKGMRKAFASGAVEGVIDGAIIMYIPMLIACYVWKSKAEKVK